MDQQLEQQHAATWLTITSSYLWKFGEVKLMSQITFLPLGPWYITYIQIYCLLYIFTWENLGVSECIKQIPLWKPRAQRLTPWDPRITRSISPIWFHHLHTVPIVAGCIGQWKSIFRASGHIATTFSGVERSDFISFWYVFPWVSVNIYL